MHDPFFPRSSEMWQHWCCAHAIRAYCVGVFMYPVMIKLNETELGSH